MSTCDLYADKPYCTGEEVLKGSIVLWMHDILLYIQVDIVKGFEDTEKLVKELMSITIPHMTHLSGVVR